MWKGVVSLQKRSISSCKVSQGGDSMRPMKQDTGGETLLLLVAVPLLLILFLFVVGGMKHEGFETRYDAEIVRAFTR